MQGKDPRKGSAPARREERHLRLLARLLLLGGLALSSRPAAAQTAPRLLILNSYHQGFAWSDAEQAGFLKRIQEAHPVIDVPIEYLDTKRYPAAGDLARMKAFLADKYRGKTFDLVVALDNPALEMLLRFRSELFADSPVVFAGVSDFRQFLSPGARITGVAEKQNVQDTLQIALTLHPRVREVLVLDDDTISGRTSRREAEAIAPLFADRARIRFLPPCTFAEAGAQIASLPQDAMVFIHSYSTDRAGLSLSLAESTRLLTAAARVPVYAGHETRLGFGVVGGYLLGGRDHGRRAAELALRVAAGEDPAAIPVDTTSTARPMFDYRQLKRFGVPVQRLPAGSTIINRPESILDKYRELVIGTFLVLAVLLILVTSLVVAIFRRRQAEATLKLNEERLRVALEGTTDGIWDWNLTSGQVYFSPRYFTMLGYEPGEFPASYESWRKLLHAEDREAAEKALRQALAQHRPFSFEFRLKAKSGEWRWILGRGKTVALDEKGEAARVAGSHSDITERKRAEESLRLSVTRIQTVINNAPIILYSFDQQGTFTFSDGQALAGMGLKPGEMVGRSALDVYRDRPDILAILRRALRGEAFSVLLPIAGRFYDVNHTPLLGESGQYLGTIGVLVDVTERRQAEQELDRFFTVALDLLCIANTEGFFRRLNPQWEVVFGYSLSELEGRRFLDLVHPDDLAGTLSALGELSAQKAVLNFVNRYRCKDGSYRWVEWRSHPAGELIYAAARDITERKQTEEEIRRLNEELEQRVVERTRQLETANRELEAFTYSVSHDMRAPLRAIGAFARILEQEHEARLDGEGRRICGVIRVETQKLSQLIDDLLAFSRYGRDQLQVTPVDMQELAASAFQELAGAAGREKLDFRLDPLPPVLGDPAMIRQVWLNLLSNALKFSSKRERAVIQVGASQQEGGTRYFVRDNGAGFDMRYKDKLFGVFQRLHSEREYEGSGVGLAIVQRVIQRHGGQVWAEGALGEGATFSFSLP
jgi:PAS domain S-box-containing protein